MSELTWERVASLRDLKVAGGVMPATFDRFKLALYFAEDKVYATADLCTHGGARLSEGYLEGYLIECPLHQGLFDIRTGAVAGPPCKRAVRTFPVRTEGDDIIIGFPPASPPQATSAPTAGQSGGG
jgi:naphthalene 1,2-dioxygenase ferredoxin component